MTILRSGTTKKYSDNWSAAFGEKPKKAKATPSGKSKSRSSGKTTKKPKKK